MKKSQARTDAHDSPGRIAVLRRRLDEILAGGLPADTLAHAERVAMIAGVLSEAFESVGLRCTVVGGSAIEIHAPGVYKSDDIDLVIHTDRGIRGDPRVADVFGGLGFEPEGRLWVRGDLVVDPPSARLSDPDEVVTVGPATFRVVKKEVLLRDRIVGFKWWPNALSYGQQAIDMLDAFGDQLDLDWLRPALESEQAFDAFVELRSLAESGGEVTEAILRGLRDRLGNPAE
jgi:hypothetical protein